MNKQKDSESLETASASAADMPFFVATNLTRRVHPLTERLDRAGLCLQSFGQERRVAGPHGDRRHRTGASRVGKWRYSSADADAGRFRNGFEARLRTAGAEHSSCRLEHALAVAQRVGTWFS